ncbi:MAG: RDD family protein [Alphaproteobacteria bacterium]|nr:RDD family protein [Alphaproteobacteria bacterium]MBV8411070.1 RDD family protein [Alphaproteobacteria bacterium]
MASVPSSGTSAPPPPTWNAQPAGAAQVAYGGFWIRLVAYIIDAIILGIVGAILGAIFGISMMSASDIDHYDPTINIVSLVIAWLYFALFESSARGATPGKMALGLRVVTGDGQRLSFLNATGRYFAKFISAIILCIGFIMIGFTERKRGLHDMMANTLVIKVR